MHKYLEGALGEARFAAACRALALPPAHTCVRVSTLKASVQVWRVIDAMQGYGMLQAWVESHKFNKLPTVPRRVRSALSRRMC